MIISCMVNVIGSCIPSKIPKQSTSNEGIAMVTKSLISREDKPHSNMFKDLRYWKPMQRDNNYTPLALIAG